MSFVLRGGDRTGLRRSISEPSEGVSPHRTCPGQSDQCESWMGVGVHSDVQVSEVNVAGMGTE